MVHLRKFPDVESLRIEEISKNEVLEYFCTKKIFLSRSRVLRLQYLKGDRLFIISDISEKRFSVFVSEIQGRINSVGICSISHIDDSCDMESCIHAIHEFSKIKKYQSVEIENVWDRDFRNLDEYKILSNFNVSNYIIDLHDDIEKNLSNNHLRNIKKFEKNDFILDVDKSDKAIQDHIEICNHSIERRIRRGERKGENHEFDKIKSLIKNGNGSIYRIFSSDKLLSSNLIDKFSNISYYHSGGTTPEGMSMGSSHYLMYKIATTLREQGFACLSLGVSDSRREGLTRFKKGFGAAELPYRRLTIDTATGMRRLVGTLAAMVRR